MFTWGGGNAAESGVQHRVRTPIRQPFDIKITNIFSVRAPRPIFGLGRDSYACFEVVETVSSCCNRPLPEVAGRSARNHALSPAHFVELPGPVFGVAPDHGSGNQSTRPRPSRSTRNSRSKAPSKYQGTLDGEEDRLKDLSSRPSSWLF